VQPDIDAEALAFGCGVPDQLPPRLGEGDEAIRRAVVDMRRPGRAGIGHAKDRRRTDARGFELLQISGYTLCGDITAHPMPPDARLCVIRRRKETLLKVRTVNRLLFRRCNFGRGFHSIRGCLFIAHAIQMKRTIGVFRHGAHHHLAAGLRNIGIVE